MTPPVRRLERRGVPVPWGRHRSWKRLACAESGAELCGGHGAGSGETEAALGQGPCLTAFSRTYGSPCSNKQDQPGHVRRRKLGGETGGDSGTCPSACRSSCSPSIPASFLYRD